MTVARRWFAALLLACFLASRLAAQPTETWLAPEETRDVWAIDDDDELVPVEPYLDLNRYIEGSSDVEADVASWGWQLLPESLIYRPYLASPKQSRTATHLFFDEDEGWLWDAWLGTQVGLLRYGSFDTDWPVGFQIDVEASAQMRLDVEDDVDVMSGDYRGGVPVTFGYGRHRTKLGYYHLSSHLGDEFLLRNPGFNRLNFARDVLVLGHSYYLTPRTRLYAETGWAFYTDVSNEWEFQFGLDYAPSGPTSLRGEPFFALNGHLREEVNFGGGLTVQTGWAWRGVTGRMLRTGLHYYNGESTQYSFLGDHQEHIGFGLWYDH